jgi:hypothetical protein
VTEPGQRGEQGTEGNRDLRQLRIANRRGGGLADYELLSGKMAEYFSTGTKLLLVSLGDPSLLFFVLLLLSSLFYSLMITIKLLVLSCRRTVPSHGAVGHQSYTYTLFFKTVDIEPAPPGGGEIGGGEMGRRDRC